jgi:hypothetical protein
MFWLTGNQIWRHVSMRVRISWGHAGHTIAVALVLGTVAMIGSAPAYGHDASATSPATANNAQHEQQEIAKFKADISHLNHDFAVLPPEINSIRMYEGAGSGPMLAAAAAWDGLAVDLQATTNSYASILTGLASESWSGPASAAMATAAAPYVAWLQQTAQQAETVAAQAKAAAASFEQGEKGSAPNS